MDVKVKGLVLVKLNLKLKVDGIIDVDYIVIVFGDYIIDVIYGDKFIKDFSFKVKISKDVVDIRVRVYGLGLEKGNV